MSLVWIFRQNGSKYVLKFKFTCHMLFIAQEQERYLCRVVVVKLAKKVTATIRSLSITRSCLGETVVSSDKTFRIPP